MNITIVEQEQIIEGDFWVFPSGEYFEVGNDDKEILGELYPDRNNLACITLTDWSEDTPKEVCRDHCLNVPFTLNPRGAMHLLKEYFKEN